MPDGVSAIPEAGYQQNKLHMVCSTDSSVVVPLTADVTTANTPDNQV